MHSTVARIRPRHRARGLFIAGCAAIAVACGGREQAGRDVPPPDTVTPGEAVGTSGTNDQLITVSGCIIKAPPDGFVLTSDDEAVLRQHAGTTGHHRDDPHTKPSDANRGAEDERLRHAQNPSAELGRYRLEGDAERLAMLVNREVEIQGRLQSRDTENSTPAALTVDTIDATGPRCGN